MKVRINWDKKESEIIEVEKGVDAHTVICDIVQQAKDGGSEKDDFHVQFWHDGEWKDGIEHDRILKTKQLKLDKNAKKFLVLARLKPEGGITKYAQEQLEVTAKNWDEAYEKVRAGGFTLYIEEYKPKPAPPQ